MELTLTDGIHEGFAELFEMALAHHVLKAPIVLCLDVDICVAEKDMLLEVSDRLKLLVAKVAGVVILELEPEPLRSIWSAVPQVAISSHLVGKVFSHRSQGTSPVP